VITSLDCLQAWAGRLPALWPRLESAGLCWSIRTS
jgi:hypothetical protein